VFEAVKTVQPNRDEEPKTITVYSPQIPDFCVVKNEELHYKRYWYSN